MSQSAPFLAEERRVAHKIRNIAHSVLLIFGIGVIMMVCAWLLWGLTGIIVAAISVFILFLFGPRISPEMVMRMYKARPIDQRQSPQLSRILEILSDRAELAIKPRLYIIPSTTLNAFATGTPNRASIAVTEGLLRSLNLREITGVLAHETSHIRNNDLWIMSIADIMSRFTQLMSYVGIFIIVVNLPLALIGMATIPWLVALLLYLAPTIGSLLQLALSRAREYDADLEAAQLTGDPDGLANALRKLEHYQGHFWEDMIFPGRRIPQPSLLRSHPPTEERIRRLTELKPEMPPISVPQEVPTIAMGAYRPITLHPKYHWPWPGIWY